MLTYEMEVWQTGVARVAGVDEAGRGPLAGPVYAAAVIFDSTSFPVAADEWEGLTDSKQLTFQQRETFFMRLTQHPRVQYAIAECSVEDIDRLNILRATQAAMARALSMLEPLPDIALVDGLPVVGLPCASRAIVKGDSASLSIAAASVLAKVARDRFMMQLDSEYPGYGFAQHKGYGTRAHMEALRMLGPCPQHRRSFSPVAQRLFDF
jgi:ribonuclease HII